MSRIAKWLGQFLVTVKGHEHVFMVVVAVLIGCLGGLGAVVFRWLISAIQRVGWGSWDPRIAEVVSQPGWWIVLVPTVGGLVVGPMVYFFAREAKGHGVPEVMEAVALRYGLLRARLVIVKTLASAVSIAAGGSVGREGPIVQIGSAIGSVVGQIIKVSGLRLRTLVGCGAAAGIAATFNAPVAGALFAVEIVLGDFAISKFSPIVISSVMATVVSRHYLGDVPAFVIPSVEMVSAWELLTYMVLGVAAGVVAVLFIKTLYGLEDLMERLPLPGWLITPIGGAAIGAIGLFRPEVFGVGYETIETALRGEMVWSLLLVLIAVKLFATSLTIAVGFSGGIFAPSLFIGAMTGGLIGTIAHELFPAVTAGPGAYALVGMGAVVAAATQAPITAILIIFELTSVYEMILPLMAACIIATTMAERLKKESIYTMKLVRRGIDIRGGREMNVLRSLTVQDEMTDDMVTVSPDETFGRLLARITERPEQHYYVVDDSQRLTGVVALSDISSSIPDAALLSNLLLMRDIARDDVPAVRPDESLATVMHIFDGRNREELPVVDPGSGRLLGIISHRHLVEAYNRELMRRDMVAELGTTLQASARAQDVVRLGDDFRMVELDAPGAFIDRSIAELGVRRRYGVEILLIRRARTSPKAAVLEVVPSADSVIRLGDRLVVMGRDEALRKIRAL